MCVLWGLDYLTRDDNLNFHSFVKKMAHFLSWPLAIWLSMNVLVLADIRREPNVDNPGEAGLWWVFLDWIMQCMDSIDLPAPVCAAGDTVFRGIGRSEGRQRGDRQYNGAPGDRRMGPGVESNLYASRSAVLIKVSGEVAEPWRAGDFNKLWSFCGRGEERLKEPQESRTPQKNKKLQN